MSSCPDISIIYIANKKNQHIFVWSYWHILGWSYQDSLAYKISNGSLLTYVGHQPKLRKQVLTTSLQVSLSSISDHSSSTLSMLVSFMSFMVAIKSRRMLSLLDVLCSFQIILVFSVSSSQTFDRSFQERHAITYAHAHILLSQYSSMLNCRGL